MKLTYRTRVAFACSLFIHLVGFLFFFSVFSPTKHENMSRSEEAISVLFPQTSRIIPKRQTERKPDIHKSVNSLQKISPGVRGMVQSPVYIHTKRYEEDESVSAIGYGSDIVIGQDSGTSIYGEKGFEGIGPNNASKRVSHTKINPIGLAEVSQHFEVNTTATLRSSEEMFPDIFREMPTEEIDTDFTIPEVDIIFIISCGKVTMSEYFQDAIDLIENEIQRYRLMSHSYRVGIIASRVLGRRMSCRIYLDHYYPHQIGCLPLSANLDEALAAVREMRGLEYGVSDFPLNTIYYALNRCDFRPNASRKIIVIGGNIMGGGYSPLNIIHLCHEKRVVLDIYGIDKLIGSPLAHETGGQWYPLDDQIKASDGAIRNFFRTMEHVSEFKLSDWIQANGACSCAKMSWREISTSSGGQKK